MPNPSDKLFPDPLLSEKFINFENYPIEHEKRITDRRISQDLYSYNDARPPLYYQGKMGGDEVIASIRQFRASQSFPLFLQELDKCFAYITTWADTHDIKINEHRASDLLNTFHDRLKSDFFDYHLSKLYSDGKKIIENIALLLREETIPLEFRKTQIINLLDDDGLARCADGCYLRLEEAASQLSQYGGMATEKLIKNYLIDVLQTTTAKIITINEGKKGFLPIGWYEHSVREILCLLLQIPLEANEIHAHHYLIKRLKEELKLDFFILPKDSFTTAFEDLYKNPDLAPLIDKLYTYFKVSFKEKLTATGLVKYIIFKISENHQIFRENLITLLGKTVSEDIYKKICDETNYFIAKKPDDSHTLIIAITDHLFSQGWLELDSSIFPELSSFEPFQRDKFCIYYANLALSWVKIEEEKQLIVELITEEFGLKQLKKSITANYESINSLIRSPQDLNLFFEKLPKSNRVAGLVWLVNGGIHINPNEPRLSLELDIRPLFTLPAYIDYLGPVTCWLNKENLRMLLKDPCEKDKANIKVGLQNELDKPIQLPLNELARLTENEKKEYVSAKLENRKIRLQSLIKGLIVEAGFTDFSHLRFPSYRFDSPLSFPIEKKMTYLDKITFTEGNFANTKFEINILNCVFYKSHFDNTQFHESLSKVDFSNSDFTLLKITNKDLVSSSHKFTNVKFSTRSFIEFVGLAKNSKRLELPYADLRAVDFQNRALIKQLKKLKVNFFAANLQGANLEGLFNGNSEWNLRKANLENCKLDSNSFDTVSLTDAKLSGTSIEGAALTANQVFEFYKQGHRDFRKVFSPDVFLDDYLPEQFDFHSNTLAGAKLSLSIFEMLYKAGFKNFQKVDLSYPSFSRSYIERKQERHHLDLTDALLPEPRARGGSRFNCFTSPSERKKRSINHCLDEWYNFQPSDSLETTDAFLQESSSSLILELIQARQKGVVTSIANNVVVLLAMANLPYSSKKLIINGQLENLQIVYSIFSLAELADNQVLWLEAVKKNFLSLEKI